MRVGLNNLNTSWGYKRVASGLLALGLLALNTQLFFHFLLSRPHKYRRLFLRVRLRLFARRK